MQTLDVDSWCYRMAKFFYKNCERIVECSDVNWLWKQLWPFLRPVLREVDDVIPGSRRHGIRITSRLWLTRAGKFYELFPIREHQCILKEVSFEYAAADCGGAKQFFEWIFDALSLRAKDKSMEYTTTPSLSNSYGVLAITLGVYGGGFFAEVPSVNPQLLLH